MNGECRQVEQGLSDATDRVQIAHSCLEHGIHMRTTVFKKPQIYGSVMSPIVWVDV